MPKRSLPLILGVLLVFGVVAAILAKLMPAPLTDADFLVIGSVATLVALLVLFFGLAGLRGAAGGGEKTGGMFFRKRNKPRQ